MTKEEIMVNAKEFLKALKFVVFSASKQDSRPILQYVHIRIEEKELIVEATDAHVLGRMKVPAKVASALVGKEFLLTSKFAKEISKTPTKHGKNLHIVPEFVDSTMGNKVTFINDNEEIFVDDNSIGDTLHGRVFYPGLDRVIPDMDGNVYSFTTTKKELLPVLRELKKTIDPEKKTKQRIVRVQFKGSKVIFEEKSVSENGLKFGVNDDFEINFNLSFLMGMLQRVDNKEKITFNFKGELRPFTLDRENGKGVGVIVPIRLNKKEF